MWASSEESIVPEESPLSSPTPSLIEGAIPSYKGPQKTEKGDRFQTQPTEGTRKLSLSKFCILFYTFYCK